MPADAGMFRGGAKLQKRFMNTATALCAALPIENHGDTAPDWLHLLPAGEVRTFDGRGPYRVADATVLMSASMASGKLALDENHSTDLAAPRGLSAPARGWIVELRNRADGIWGRVEWTEEGRRLVPGYRGISPVIGHRKDGTVTAIFRASLTNTPNLTGLTALHAKDIELAFREDVIGALGLDAGADDAAIVAAVAAGKKQDGTVALQAALAPIARVLGVAETADAATVLAGVQQLKGGGDDRVVALQSELSAMTKTLNTVTEDRARDKATAFVDAAVGLGRVGVRPMRDTYIDMHMKDAAQVEKLVGAMPILAPGATVIRDTVQTEDAEPSPALLAQQATAYQAKLAATGVTIDIATAVRAVQEGKAK